MLNDIPLSTDITFLVWQQTKYTLYNIIVDNEILKAHLRSLQSAPFEGQVPLQVFHLATSYATEALSTTCPVIRMDERACDCVAQW